MMKIKNKQDLFQRISKEYQQLYGERLDSLYIYGSAITDDFDASTSDINVAIIIDDLQLKSLIPARDLIKKLGKKGVSSPLFLSKDYIKTSLDTFPIEFLDIKSNHKTLFGDDFFSEINFDPSDLRLQAERELKGKLLLLRLSFLENIQKKKYILSVIKKSIKSILPILKAILKFTNSEIPENSFSIIKATEQNLDFDLPGLVQAFYYSKQKKIRSKTKKIVEFYQLYVIEVDKLSRFVDKYQIS